MRDERGRVVVVCCKSAQIGCRAFRDATSISKFGMLLSSMQCELESEIIISRREFELDGVGSLLFRSFCFLFRFLLCFEFTCLLK